MQAAAGHALARGHSGAEQSHSDQGTTLPWCCAGQANANAVATKEELQAVMALLQAKADATNVPNWKEKKRLIAGAASLGP